MINKKIVIWGAGRIGRGFIADLFFQADYKVTFVDQSADLVNHLNQNGSYSIILADGKNERRIHRHTGYRALTIDEGDEIQKAVDQSDLIAVAVYPDTYPVVAKSIASYIFKRREVRGNDPIDILLCTNLIHAGPKFQKLMQNASCEPVDLEFLNAHVGVVESLVIRICPDPKPEDVAFDQLVVLTNGYPILPVEKAAFKAPIPRVDSLRLVDDMRAEEMRKIYTYNMCHAVLAYHGAMRGKKLLVQCLEDPSIKIEAEQALLISGEALQKEYGFSAEDMQHWIIGVLEQTNNPLIGDTVDRSAADPVRKLAHDDRLIGPALLCLKHGITPGPMARAAGAAFCYRNSDDPGSRVVQQVLEQKGIDEAIKTFCGLESGDLFESIKHAYLRLPLEIEWQRKAAEAERLGFYYEQVFHGCGQCAMAALMDVLNVKNDGVFEATTALSGGIGQVGDGSCSAYIAGVMIIGMLYPRRRDHFDGDRESKYKSFQLVQELRDKFIKEYGSITCKDIHQARFGRSFDLRYKSEQILFEEAGGHRDGCTNTVGIASRWAIEVIAEHKIDSLIKS
jgi:mannitol-1-phosphate 5-dehydrogenase